MVDINNELVEKMKLGWSIFPCDWNKHPLVKWKQFQEKSPSLEQVAKWAKKEGDRGRKLREFPAYWAAVTGNSSRILVLDFDGEPGQETLARLGLRPHVITPSGGAHVYFQHPGCRVRTLNHKSNHELGSRWAGLDIRADGGFAIFFGATEKGEYRWLRPSMPDSLDLLPNDLKVFLGLEHPPEPAGRLAIPSPPHGKQRRPQGLSAFISVKSNGRGAVFLAKALDAVSRGEGRNNAGFSLCLQLRDNKFSKSDAKGVLQEFVRDCPRENVKGQVETYSLQDALRSLDSAYSRMARQPWGKGIDSNQ